jgi:preprotein translocase subunit SecG
MQLAAINWLSISINLLLVAFVIVCILMTLLILMQRPKQEGLGAAFGGGVTDQVFGARTTNVLQRGTVYLGSLFFLISLALAVLIGNQNRKISLLSPQENAAAVEEAATPATDEPALPKSLSEELPVDESVPADETTAVDSTPAGESGTDDESIPADAAPAGETPVEVAPAAPADESAEENSDQP